MADPRFFTVGGPFTLEKIAAIAGAELGAGAAPDKVIVDVAPLETAGPEHLSFLDNPRYVEAFAASRAGACLVRPAHVGRAPGGMALLIALNPYRSYARAARAFYPEAEAAGSIHASAVRSVSTGKSTRQRCQDKRPERYAQVIRAHVRRWVRSMATRARALRVHIPRTLRQYAPKSS